MMKVVRFGVSGTALAGAKSASELLKEESVKIPIYTFCLELDDLLGGGVATGEITELCGCPGIGKTQTGIQLCCSVQIPAPFGGHDGQAVYVDTEGSFMAERAADVAAATVEHLGAIARASPEDQGMADAMASFTVERVLERIHLFRCHEVTELLAVLETLPAYCARRGVKLVVIDSVAFHFRQDFRDMALRTTILAKMTNRLMDLATRQDLAVVTVNQVTVKPDPSGVGGARLVPALGESYAHACTTRVILSWEDDVRTAYLYKSPRLAQGRARYTVTEGGSAGRSRDETIGGVTREGRGRERERDAEEENGTQRARRVNTDTSWSSPWGTPRDPALCSRPSTPPRRCRRIPAYRPSPS